ncbi:MAG: hypothetical protein J6M53_08950 [Bacteroidaceae bacterium]|nr:hypothetical protein [Bacteroidaceae bacterium]
MKKTRFALLALFALSFSFLSLSTLYAQEDEARTFVDRVATKLKGIGSLEAQFSTTAYSGQEVVGEASGKLTLKGRKFKLVSPAMQQWFDGTTLWALEAGSDEIYVSKPTRTELQQINPYNFIDLYKQGFILSTASDTYQNKPVTEVHMLSKSTKNPIQEIYITVGQDLLPACIRFRNGKKNWTKIMITSLRTGIHVSDSDFQLDTARYPNYEVIDLR